MTIRKLNNHLKRLQALQIVEEQLRTLRATDPATLADCNDSGYFYDMQKENRDMLISQQERYAAELRAAAERSSKEVLEFLSEIPDERVKTILEYRYLFGYKWDAAAAMIGNGYTASGIKSAAFRYLNRATGYDGILRNDDSIICDQAD